MRTHTHTHTHIQTLSDVGDYNTIRSTLSFQSNSKISCINVTTLLDGVLEDTEYFTLQMNSTNPNTDTNDVTQIFIIDSDGMFHNVFIQ